MLYADLAVNQCVSSPASGSSLTSLSEMQLSAVNAVKINSGIVQGFGRMLQLTSSSCVG